MTYKFIVEVDTGEILFDLVHDLNTQNIRAIKLIAKKLNAVLRQKENTMEKELHKKTEKIMELAESIVDDLQDNSKTYTEAIDKLQAMKLERQLDDFIYSTLHLRMVQEKPTVKDRLRFD